VIDGIFGNNTYNAVVNFQRNNGLAADGVVGCNTWTKLVSIARGYNK
ncbi:MAG: peptidoglycan-binding protein, partial [Clostridia bacterium]|nr:peptidoglycan-binding protein [Clostridia bacterium]